MFFVFNEMNFGQPHPETQRELPVTEVGLHDAPVLQVQPDVPAPQHESSPPERSCRLRHQPIRYGSKSM